MKRGLIRASKEVRLSRKGERMEMAKQRKRHRRGEGVAAASPQRQIQVGENSSNAVWFRGWDPELGVEWYRVEIDVADLEEQIKIRLSRKQEICEILDIPHSVLKQGLSIQPDSILAVSHCSGQCVAVGRFLCCAGGLLPKPPSSRARRILSTDISCLDTTQLDLVWKTYAMTTGRVFPLMAAMHDKVYIIGSGSEFLDLDLFAEVFDPLTGKSQPLPPYPKDAERHPSAIVALPHQNKIMLCFKSNSIVYYDVTDQHWYVERDQLFFSTSYNPYGGTYAAVGDTIYWFSIDSDIAAYDFRNKEIYLSQKRVQRSQELATLHPVYVTPTLLHLTNDLFCLVWIDSMFYKIHHTYYNVIHCTKLNISKCSHTKSLAVSLLHTQSYLVKTKQGFLGAVLTNLKMEQ